jgi:hypothetical protein
LENWKIGIIFILKWYKKSFMYQRGAINNCEGSKYIIFYDGILTEYLYDLLVGYKSGKLT